MAITIQVPYLLRPCCRGAAELSVAATTVREALEHLAQRHPELYRSVCNETGAVRQHMNLFVNLDLLRGKSELDVPLQDGDVLSIFQAVSGG